MKNILEELAALRLADAEEREKTVPLAEMEHRAAAAPAPRRFKGGVIAELKRASPSEGMIRGDFKPVELARSFEAAGASAISVLCEPHRFLGSEEYLRAVREVTDLPLLYKDFISSEYQIAAARAAGADMVLLVAATLKGARLAELARYALSTGMEPLVETHDAEEIGRAVDSGARIIGVNCRDLRDFSTDVSLFGKLLGEIPADRLRVAESGMRTAQDVSAAHKAGAGAFLAGTALMRSGDPAAVLREFVAAAGNAF